jgi:hypothetical protein
LHDEFKCASINYFIFKFFAVSAWQFLFHHYIVNPLQPLQSDSIKIEWTPANDQPFFDTIQIFHNALNSENPIKITVKGKAVLPTSIQNSTSEKTTQNYPNPFSEYTAISYTVDQPASLIVYNISGQVINKYDELNVSGLILFDGSNLPCGIYIYKLITQDRIEITHKMTIFR